jgi:hypothetical protein
MSAARTDVTMQNEPLIRLACSGGVLTFLLILEA